MGFEAFEGITCPVKTGTEPDRVFRLSWTEYAEDLSLSQKMLFFQMKSEVFCVESECFFAYFQVRLYLCPTVFCCTLQRFSEQASYFGNYTLSYCLQSMSKFI